MGRSISHQTAVMLVSVVIIVILGSQFIIGLTYNAPGAWPIVSYPMYRNPHYEGDRLRHRFDVRAVVDDQTYVPITAEDLGMRFWLFVSNIVWPLEKGRTDHLDFLIDRYCAETDGRLDRLEVWDVGVAIGRNGPVHGLEPKRFAAADVSCG